MKNKNKKNTGITYNIIIVLLILIILTSLCVGIFAWAKYTSAINGTATAQVAKWSFKVVDTNPQTTDVIELAVTRTDGYEHVEEGKLAPGTFGEFEIGIDARGTETVLEYTIDILVENLPRNLVFYADENKTEVLEIVDATVTKTGYMSLEDVKEIRTEKIYWEWPYQTGATNAEIIANDEKDTEDAGKVITMQITVTGTEVLEESTNETKLVDVVEIGDYVNYDASSNGVKTFTKSNCLSGTDISATVSTANTFNSAAPSQWRVLSVDKENGIVELMATDPTSQILQLDAGEGFINSETVLNSIGAIYGHGKGATGGRSIKLEDFEQYSSYVPSSQETGTFTDGSFYKQVMDGEGNVIDYEPTLTEASISNPITMIGTSIYCKGSDYFSNSIYNMLFKNSTNTSVFKEYWLASRVVSVDEEDEECDFNVMRVYGNGVLSSKWLYAHYDDDDWDFYGVVPVVTLEANILTTGQDSNGVWKLDV